MAFAQDFYKDTFPGHDACPDLFIYFTVVMAFLPDLSDLRQAFPELQPGSDRQRMQGDALCCNVLGKSSRTQPVYSRCRHLIDALLREKADLTMPVSRMRVPDDSVIDAEIG